MTNLKRVCPPGGYAGHLAAYAGLVPAARDSGKRTGNNRRMRGGNKLLKKVLYQSAFSSFLAEVVQMVPQEILEAEVTEHGAPRLTSAPRGARVIATATSRRPSGRGGEHPESARPPGP